MSIEKVISGSSDGAAFELEKFDREINPLKNKKRRDYRHGSL